MSTEDVQNALLQLLRLHLKQPTLPGSRLHKANLFELGLDSGMAVQLLLGIEDTFGITFPNATLTPSLFRDVERLECLIQELLSSRG